MRTYISPIGFDTRRITRPLITQGIAGDDKIVLLRPDTDPVPDQAQQAVADIEQFLQEVEPGCEMDVQPVVTESVEETTLECIDTIDSVPEERVCIVSLSGGARDILLPLTIASLLKTNAIESTLFFSDIDNSVTEWPLPDLTTTVPSRAEETFQVIADVDDWITLSSVTDRTEYSKSTVIRHVNDLEAAGLILADTSSKAKRVQLTFTGQLFARH